MAAKPAQVRFVLKFIASNPGCSRGEIATGCKFSPRLVGDILETLREQSEVTMEGGTRNATYTAVSLREKVMKAVRYHAEATRAFLAEKLEVEPKRVGYVLQALTREGKLLRLGTTRDAVYFHPQYHHRHHRLQIAAALAN